MTAGPVLPVYSSLDRFLYRMAFSSVSVQKVVAELEASIFAKLLKNNSDRSPIFISSLPRCGTTLLLELLYGAGGLASNTYRDMPFVLCPILWDKLSAPFRRAAVTQERAHGDGMDVSFDSPEAFEEIIWKLFWPEHYGADGISLWTAGRRNSEFEEFFRAHMRKIIALRAPGGRYVSKNNTSIARIAYLSALFPDCRIVIPFREPVEHAASLLNQHSNFQRLQATDPFGAKYLDYIGHFEFGSAFRPLKFPGAEALSELNSATLDFWLEYWCCAYAYLLSREQDSQSNFVDFDQLTLAPRKTLQHLFQWLHLDAPPHIEALEAKVSRPRSLEIGKADKDRIVRALDLHGMLHARAKS